MQKNTFLANKTIALDVDWTFRQENEKKNHKAIVPGLVHTDLLRLNKIPQPFYRNNEKELQWIDKKNWIYHTTITIDTTDLKAHRINLVFHGIDTYAEVKINNQPILAPNNMFRKWETDIKPYITAGKNDLTIKLLSPVQRGLTKLDALGYALPAENDQSEKGGLGNKKISVFTRKAPYHYGWDWGPRFVTMGIWRPVELQVIHQPTIRNVHIIQDKITGDKAYLRARIAYTSPETGKYHLQIKDKKSNTLLSKEPVTLHKSKGATEIAFRIKDPKRWWPNGYGDPFLYSLQVSLLKDNHVLDQQTIQTGLRTIELIRENDEHGQTFYFEVNNVPVFAKGANYIPGDNFLTEVNREKYENTIQSAVQANMNMIRVWGGGIYENDIFYDLCDQYGLLVWQDFMFACSMYPGNDQFLENVKQEAVDNIKRLRNHPSIALWCGNNEIDAAWCNGKEDCGWGWKEQYTPKQQEEIWHAYDTLFHAILPKMVDAHDGTRTYWPSSPLADWGKSAHSPAVSGNMHYWGVWHGNEPFEAFNKVPARFISEYGFQSFPELNTIKEFTLPQDHNLHSEVMKSHQRSPSGNEKIMEYLQLYYPQPHDFNDLLYLSQSLQAFGIKKAIQAHRIQKPYCMGTLYWQLNDSWPGASWSSIDYYGNWKALHYKVRDAFKPTALAFQQQNGQVSLYVLNDDPELTHATVELNACDFEGHEHQLFRERVAIKHESANLVFNISMTELAAVHNLNGLVLSGEIRNDSITVDSELYYTEKPKNINLPECHIQPELIDRDNGTYTLTLKTNKLAKDVAIAVPYHQVTLENNYFDMLPGTTRELEIKTKNNETITIQDIRIETLNNHREH